jgi:RNA polymerase I-specific transcription initiation factor RRN3
MTTTTYLASYFSHAKHFPLFVASASLKRFVYWCLTYMPHHNGDWKVMNPRVHGVFYSTCQTIMYILCYQMKVLVYDPKHRLLLEQLQLKNFIELIINLVKACFPSIVEQFLR